MAEEEGGIVASQASVVIGADWSAVDAALNAVKKLEATIAPIKPMVAVALKMPDIAAEAQKLRAAFETAFAKPLEIPVVANLHATAIADLQRQLNQGNYSINVRANMVPGTGGGGAPTYGGHAGAMPAAGPTWAALPPSAYMMNQAAGEGSNVAQLRSTAQLSAAGQKAQMQGQAFGMNPTGVKMATLMAETGLTAAGAARKLFPDDKDARLEAQMAHEYNRRQQSAMDSAARFGVHGGTTADDLLAARESAEQQRAARAMEAADWKNKTQEEKQLIIQERERVRVEQRQQGDDARTETARRAALMRSHGVSDYREVPRSGPYNGTSAGPEVMSAAQADAVRVQQSLTWQQRAHGLAPMPLVPSSRGGGNPGFFDLKMESDPRWQARADYENYRSGRMDRLNQSFAETRAWNANPFVQTIRTPEMDLRYDTAGGVINRTSGVDASEGAEAQMRAAELGREEFERQREMTRANQKNLIDPALAGRLEAYKRRTQGFDVANYDNPRDPAGLGNGALSDGLRAKRMMVDDGTMFQPFRATSADMVGKQAEIDAQNELTNSRLLQMRAYGRVVPQDNRTEAEASVPGAFSRVPYTPGMSATVARNDFFLTASMNARGLFGRGPAGAAELARREAQGMKLQQDARRYYFAGQTLTRAITLPTVAVGGLMLKQGINFDSQFGKIASLTDTDPSTLRGLQQQVIDLGMGRGMGRGEHVTQSPTELEDALYEVGSAGYTGASGRRVMQASARGATVGLGDSKVVADAVTTTLAAYRLPASHSEEIVNSLLKGVIAGKGDATAYAPALGKVISTAANAGVDYHEVIANIATMSRVGIKPDVGATSLNQLLMHIATPTPQGEKAMAQIGYSRESIKKALSSSGMGLQSLEFDIIKKSNATGRGDEIQEQLLGNVRGYKALISTAGVQAGAYKQILAEQRNGQDQTAKSMEAMGNTFEAQWKRITNTVKGTSLEITSRAMPGLTKYVQAQADALPNHIGAAQDLYDSTPDWSHKAGLAAFGGLALTGPAFNLMAIGKDLSSFGKSRPGFGAAAAGLGVGVGLARYAVPAAFDFARTQGYDPSDGLVMAAQAAVLAPSLYRPAMNLAKSFGGLEAGINTGIGNVSTLYGKGRTAYQAFNAAREAEGLAGGAARFVPWMARGGNVTSGGFSFADSAGAAAAGANMAASGLAGAGVAGGAAEAAGITAGGLAGAAGFAAIPLAIGAGAVYYQHTQRELADRQASREEIQGRDIRVGWMFDRADSFAGGDKSASDELGAIGTKFAAARGDAKAYGEVLKDLQQYNFELGKGDFKLSPLAKASLKVDVNKMIGEVQSQIKAVEVQVKIKTSYQEFKDDIAGVTTGQTAPQQTSADILSRVGDVTGILGKSAQFLENMGISLPYAGTEESPALPFYPADPATRAATAAQRAAGVAAANNPLARMQADEHRKASGANFTPESDNERYIQTATGTGIKNGTNIKNWVESAPKTLIDKLAARLTSDIGANKPTSHDLRVLVTAREETLKRQAQDAKDKAGNVTSGPTPADTAAMESQRAGLESQAQAAGKLASAYGTYGSAIDGIMARTRSMADETERNRTVNEMFKRSLDGVSESYKKQAIELAGLNDRMKEMQGLKTTLRGFNEGLEGTVSGVGGNLAGLHSRMAPESALLDYSGRMGALSRVALRRGAGLAELANGQVEGYTQQANDLRNQAGAVGSDLTQAYGKNGLPGGAGVNASGARSLFEKFNLKSTVDMTCADVAGKTVESLGFHINKSLSAAQLEKNAIAGGWRPVSAEDAPAGSLAFKYSASARSKVHAMMGLGGGELASSSNHHTSYFHATGKERFYAPPGAGVATATAQASAQGARVVVDAKGHSHVAQTALIPASQASRAPENPARFDGTDSSLTARSADLQWALGKRLSPTKYNTQQFALQQMLERKDVQLSFAEAGRAMQFGAGGHKNLSDSEVSELAALDGMTDAQRGGWLRGHPAIARKLVGAMQSSARFADAQVNRHEAYTDYRQGQRADQLAGFSASRPLDSYGLRRLQIAQNENPQYTRKMRQDDLRRFGVNLGRGDVYAAGEAQWQVDARNNNLAAGRSYIEQSPNWNQGIYDDTVELDSFRATEQHKLVQRSDLSAAAKKRLLDASVATKRGGILGARKNSDFIQLESQRRSLDDKAIDAATLRDYARDGMDPELAGIETAYERDRISGLRLNETDAQATGMAGRNRGIAYADIETANLDRYNEGIKDSQRGLASIGDTTGLTARSIELNDRVRGLGLSGLQRHNALYQEENLQGMTREYDSGMARAPLFYGNLGARNGIEAAQSELDYAESKRGRSIADKMAAGMTGFDATTAFNSSLSPLQSKLSQAQLVEPRQASIDMGLRAEAMLRGTKEETATQKAITDAQKERLYVLKAENEFLAKNLTMTEADRKAAQENAKAQVAADHEAEKATRARQRSDQMQGMMKSVTGDALENLFGSNGADKKSRQLSLRDEDYRWGEQSMDMLDRGYSRTSTEFKTANKRHDELQREMRGPGMLEGLGREVVGGWAQNSRKMAAQAVNDKLFDIAGPTLGKIFGGKEKGKDGEKETIKAQSVTLNAQSVIVNGQDTGPGSMVLGGGNDPNQKSGFLGEFIQGALNR